jgi:hypothetical protein
MKDGKMDYMGKIVLTIVLSSQLWESGSPMLVQIFTNTACRLLFIAGKNA